MTCAGALSGAAFRRDEGEECDFGERLALREREVRALGTGGGVYETGVGAACWQGSCGGIVDMACCLESDLL